MAQLLGTEEDNVIAALIRGKISKNDIEKIHSHIHTIARKGIKVDFLFVMENVHGYEPSGIWADLKVDSTHISDYGKWPLLEKKIAGMDYQGHILFNWFQGKVVQHK